MADTTSENTNNYAADGSSQSYGGYNSGTDVTNAWTQPSAARLASSGLFSGAMNAISTALNIGFGYSNATATTPEADWRLRVSCAPVDGILYYDNNNPLLAPLRPTSGVVFPYTPTVTVQHNARYGAQQLTHSNYAAYFYEGSEVAAINIQGDFTVQNAAEGQYLLAAIYFFRAATKMFFGQDFLAGNPPPLLFLDGYGSHYFPHVPCVLTSVQHVMPPDVDYVEFPVNTSLLNYVNQTWGSNQLANTTRLPTSSQIQITLQPVYSRANIHNNFTFTGFAHGNLLGGAQSTTNIPGGFI